MPSSRIGICLIACAFFASSSDGRTWRDASGKYSLEANLIGFDDELVILQRANRELGSCRIEDLSEEDQKYLKSREAREIHSTNIDQLQTWTTRKGLQVVGRIVDFCRRSITIQRRRGKIYVDNILYSNLPDIYQTMLLGIVEHYESTPIPTKKDFEKWVVSLRGQPRTYDLEGVVMEFEHGNEYEVPFILFSEKDAEFLKPGWERWLADHEDHSKRDDHAFELQAQAAAYQQDQQINRQIAQMNLQMQAIQSGLTSAWEVTLYPVAGNPNPPKWVVMMGRNSEIATQYALQQNPGYIPGPVRRVSN